MDELVKKIAALGIPGVILVAIMGTTGLTGAAAITTALAFLGGPTGMLGGITVLGIVGLISETLAQTSFEDLLIAIYCQRRLNEPQGKLIAEIDNLSLFNPELKERLKLTVTEGCGCATTVDSNLTSETRLAIAILDTVEGMNIASIRDFKQASPIIRLRDGSTLRTWKNLLGFDHVFIANVVERMVYGGWGTWGDTEKLSRAIAVSSSLRI